MEQRPTVRLIVAYSGNHSPKQELLDYSHGFAIFPRMCIPNGPRWLQLKSSLPIASMTGGVQMIEATLTCWILRKEVRLFVLPFVVGLALFVEDHFDDQFWNHWISLFFRASILKMPFKYVQMTASCWGWHLSLASLAQSPCSVACKALDKKLEMF